MSTLAQLNALPTEKAVDEFMRCCGSKRWAFEMAKLRPFHNLESLCIEGERIWKSLSNEDWLEAFSHHPRIGDVDALRAKFATGNESAASWVKQEQGGVAGASEEALHGLATLNRDYEDRFGFIFLVCATGKGAKEMLEILRTRMKNEKTKELAIAAGEQAKITKLRLEKWIQS